MRPVIFIRPQPGCDESLAAAKKLGLDAHCFPLFQVRPVPWEAPDAGNFDALLIGSANALRHGGAAIGTYRSKPVYAVGAKTAQACRQAGLEVFTIGKGGLQDLLAMLEPEHTRILRLTGNVRVALDLPAGVTLIERIVYSSDPVEMPDALTRMLEEPAVAALHSAEAARHFGRECDRRALDRSRISLAGIAPRVIEAAGEGWQSLESAASPDEEALLALARKMCDETGKPRQTVPTSRKGPMEDQKGLGQEGIGTSVSELPQRRSVGRKIGVPLLAFILGATAVVWTVWRGYLDELLPRERAQTQVEASDAPQTLTPSVSEPVAVETNGRLEAVSTVEGRLAMLEDRFSRLNLQANAASGNAARAESLLIAFAARRMIDRGEPLRYLADQLQLRFANAQPRAVTTIINFAKSPVTIDQLSARLEALAPQLSGKSANASFWHSAINELSDIFSVRREPSELISSEARLERARVMLRAGRVTESVAEVRRLPGAEAATTWIVDAQRYAEVRHALDLIETAAMLEPTRLKDGEGNRVKQPSPLAVPADTPDTRLGN